MLSTGRHWKEDLGESRKEDSGGRWGHSRKSTSLPHIPHVQPRFPVVLARTSLSPHLCFSRTFFIIFKQFYWGIMYTAWNSPAVSIQFSGFFWCIYTVVQPWPQSSFGTFPFATERFLVPICNHFLFLVKPQITSGMLSVSRCLLFLDISCKWDHINICV